MLWKRFLLSTILWGLVFTSGFAQKKAKDPVYYKSNVSTRFVKSMDQNQMQSGEISGAILAAVLPETLRVMAVRVQFQKDNDRSTTGNGWFDLSETDSVMINPPPHDYQYFANQLKALKDYYEQVSHKKLILKITDESGKFSVYPQQPDSVWTLSQPMSYYNPNTTDEELDQRLAELFRDAIEIADANSNLDFSNYDVYIVYHAGVGWEFTQEFDTTPNDIPSVFLNFNDLKKTIGDNALDWQGIAVNSGSHFVKEGIILPETESQGGYEFGLLGTAANMFGHQLGLPNLFDTDTGHPGIGRFGLMDQGSGSFSGLLPVHPCAWSKIFLGWEKPIEITSGDSLPVAASLAAGESKIYKIPINAKEYYLIENRQRAILKNRKVAVGYDEDSVRVEFSDDGNINLPTGLKRLGVIVSVDEYDFGLPGSGILIWHIDENVIERYYEENRVNADMYHRGVDLVEADGAQDIGHFFNFFGITGFDAGSVYDMWWDENGEHLYANSSEKVMFTPYTMPQTRAYSGANTGIYITDFSAPDSIMYFSLEIKYDQLGFPVFLGANSGTSPVVSGDLDNNGQRELVAATESGEILAWRINGTKYIDNTDETVVVNINGDTTYIPLSVFAQEENRTFELAPSLADLNNDGKLEVIAASNEGWLYVYKPEDQNDDGRADLLFEFNSEDSITTVPVIEDLSAAKQGPEIALGLANGDVCVLSGSGELIFKKNIADAKITGLAIISQRGLVLVADDGTIYRLDETGETLWQYNLANSGTLNYPALGDVNNDGNPEIIISSASGQWMVLDENGSPLPEFHSASLECPLSNPVLADIDNNGYLDIMMTGGGKIYAFNYAGVLINNFPLLIERDHTQQRYPDPIVADLDKDDLPDIIVGSHESQLLAFDMNGKKRLGFPLSISGSLLVNAGVTDLSGDQKLNLFARSNDNYCYAWQLDSEYDPTKIYWGEYLKNSQHNALYLAATQTPEKQGNLMPEKTVYNYPNPTEGNATTIRYYLRDAADVSIKIYDMAGELIDELIGTGIPEMDNEVVWDISNVESGVYLCRVSAQSKNATNVTIIKIAVIK